MKSMNERSYLAPTKVEQYLLARARTGNAQAFDELVKPHWHSLLRSAQRILHNREDAEDAVQTALLNAWCKLDSFQGRARFSSWLTRIAINSALMRLRAKRFKNEVSLDEVTQPSSTSELHEIEARFSPEVAFSVKEIFGHIESGLRHLGPHYVGILDISVLQELTGKEAAHVLDLPVTTVKSRLYRARRLLSQRIRPKLGPRHEHPGAAGGGRGTLLGRTATTYVG